ncbi:MAG: hypothetical protein J3Q66DRAFT_442794, partial [Benniella sp.]
MTQAESLKTRSRKGRRSQGGSGAHEEETLPTLKAMFESQKAEEEEMRRLEEARLWEEKRNRQIEEEETTKAAAKLKKKKEKAKVGQQPKEGTYSTKLKRKLKPRQLCTNSQCWKPASLLKVWTSQQPWTWESRGGCERQKKKMKQGRSRKAVPGKKNAPAIKGKRTKQESFLKRTRTTHFEAGTQRTTELFKQTQRYWRQAYPFGVNRQLPHCSPLADRPYVIQGLGSSVSSVRPMSSEIHRRPHPIK